MEMQPIEPNRPMTVTLAAAAGVQLHQWYRNGSAMMQRIA